MAEQHRRGARLYLAGLVAVAMTVGVAARGLARIAGGHGLLSLQVLPFLVRRAGQRLQPLETGGRADRVGGRASDPFDIRPKARLAGEVERQMHAETGLLGDRIDQMRERRAARQPPA